MLAAIRSHLHDGRLNCAEAFEIAAEFQVRPAEVGRICNRHGIRIANCQLGCF
jgi:hypothetical protein